MSVLLEKLRGFFTTNANWNLYTKKKFTFPSSINTEQDPNQFWEIVGDIGDGAFGKIYKAQNKESGIYSALKQVNVDDEADLNQYSVEVIILTELKHTHIVGLHEAFYHNSRFWMYLEYCSVGAVDNIIHDLEHGLSEQQIRCIVKQMCKGLKFLHENSVIHRDLKAGNVLITSDATVKLADFGVSAKCSSPDQKRSTFIGTPYWMAPEVVACETTKDSPYDLRADIWSLGITIIEFAQIDPPYSKMNPARVAIKIMRSEPPTFDKPAKWSSELNDFVAKCLQKEPSDRFLTSQLLQHAFLQHVESNLPIMQLISEVKADVTIELCDVESQDNMSSSLSNSNSSDDLLAASASPSRSPTSEKASFPSSEKLVVAGVKDFETLPKENGEDCRLQGYAECAESASVSEPSLPDKDVVLNGHDSVNIKGRGSDVKKVVDEEVQELSLAIADDEENLPQQSRQGDVNGWPTNGFHQGKFGTKPSQQLLLKSGASGGHSDQVFVQSPDGTGSDNTFDRESGRYRSLTKTRSYVYEGNVITHRTSKVIVSGDENRLQEDHQTRKANFRALKLLQFTENQKVDLLKQRFLIQNENLDRHFEQELKESLRRYSSDCEQLSKDHKQEVERLEAKQSADYRTLSKNIKERQERELRAFQDSLKRELRVAKRESVGIPKHLLRRQIEQKEVEFAEAERTYREHQSEMMKKALNSLSSKQRNEMATLESKLLSDKHQLLRVYEGELWGLEEKRLEQKTELQQQQLRQLFDVHEEQAAFRHTQELEQARRARDRDLMKLRQKLAADSKEAAKKLKVQLRVEQQQLKENIKSNALSAEQEKEKLKEFEERTKEKIRDGANKQEMKMRRAINSFEHDHSAHIAELKQLYNDRMMDLDQQLNEKLHNENIRHRSEKMDWQFNLSSRKQILEEEFSWQMAEQRRFYSQVNLSVSSHPFASSPSSVPESTASWMNSDNHISTAL